MVSNLSTGKRGPAPVLGILAEHDALVDKVLGEEVPAIANWFEAEGTGGEAGTALGTNDVTLVAGPDRWERKICWYTERKGLF
jgi:hypothetical protein